MGIAMKPSQRQMNYHTYMLRKGGPAKDYSLTEDERKQHEQRRRIEEWIEDRVLADELREVWHG